MAKKKELQILKINIIIFIKTKFFNYLKYFCVTFLTLSFRIFKRDIKNK